MVTTIAEKLIENYPIIKINYALTEKEVDMLEEGKDIDEICYLEKR